MFSFLVILHYGQNPCFEQVLGGSRVSSGGSSEQLELSRVYVKMVNQIVFIRHINSKVQSQAKH